MSTTSNVHLINAAYTPKELNTYFNQNKLKTRFPSNNN